MIKQKTIKKILKENKEYFDAFEHYDKTKEWLIGRKRLDITLDRRLIKKLKEIKNKTGKPVSQIIEECINEKLAKELKINSLID